MPKITELPTATSVTSDDYVLLVNDPAGSPPTTQHARISDILALATTVLAGATWAGVWQTSAVYATGKVVSYNNNVYVCIVGHTSAAAFATDLASGKWQLLNAQGPPGDQGTAGTRGDTGTPGIPNSFSSAPWASGITYGYGTAVTYDVTGSTYVSIVTSATAVPTNTSEWRKISAQGPQGVKPFETPTTWQSGIAYNQGNAITPASAVTNGGGTYVCKLTHTSGTSFSTDLSTGKWTTISSPGLTAVTTTSPLSIDNSVPSYPQIVLSKNVAGGVPILNSLGGINRNRIPIQIIQFRHLSQTADLGNVGGSSGIALYGQGTNTSYNSRKEIARIIIPADPIAVTAGYTRRVELEAHMIIDLPVASSALQFCWVRDSDTYRLPPTTMSDSGVPVGLSNYRRTSTTIRAMGPSEQAVTEETYLLCAWTYNDTGWGYDFNLDPFNQNTVRAVILPTNA